MNPLRIARGKANLTIEELSKKSGVAPNTISTLERGIANAIPRTINKLANALGVPFEDLASLAEQVPNEKAA